MKILLLRHGITEANEKHLYCGSTDLPLSPAGRAALRRREMELTPLLTQCRSLWRLTAHYYDRSYHKDERFTL